MTRGKARRSLTEYLKTLVGISDDTPPAPRTRIHHASFPHTHRVWEPPEPSRKRMEEQGLEHYPRKQLKWW